MNTKPQFTRVASYGIVLRERNILLCRCAAYLPEGGQWTLPGGGIEFGESPETAMVREVNEETGLVVEPSALAGIDSISGEEPSRFYHSIRIVYFASELGGELRNETDGSTDLCAWHPLDSIHELPTLDLVRKSLQFI